MSVKLTFKKIMLSKDHDIFLNNKHFGTVDFNIGYKKNPYSVTLDEGGAFVSVGGSDVFKSLIIVKTELIKHLKTNESLKQDIIKIANKTMDNPSDMEKILDKMSKKEFEKFIISIEKILKHK